MKILRIINKQGYFIRDDFTFDEETEIGLDVEASQGLYLPKWDGEKWVEGATQDYINSTQLEQIKSDEELINDLKSIISELKERRVI